MTRVLTQAEIESCAGFLGAQSNIVRRILSGIGPNSSTDIRDLFFAAKLQGWSRGTIQAILNGIAQASEPRQSLLEHSNPQLRIPNPHSHRK